MIVAFLVAVDFMNFDYTSLPCSSNVPPPARVRKGSYSYFDQKMGTGFDVNVESVKHGSLRAGTEQAVVVLSCQFPIGGTAAAYAYDVHGDSATLLGEVGEANWGGDWGAGPDSIHIRFANDKLYVDSCKGDDCRARELRTYVLRGQKLIKISAQTTPSGH
ncbi:MAG: hypothetical protein JO194_06640 [Candidatus Eremiobacteraeota bacterium]|nr:hypothetical protein [Candidatus Eremiobacteraeota bacterium]